MSTTTSDERLSPREQDAWMGSLRTHAVLTRALDGELESEHRLSVHAFEVLGALADEPCRRLRMSALAARVGLTPSGATRLVTGLYQAGLLVRDACPEDGRVTSARLTQTGAEKLRAAERTHTAGVRRLFAERLAGAEMAELASLLGRLESDADDDR